MGNKESKAKQRQGSTKPLPDLANDEKIGNNNVQSSNQHTIPNSYIQTPVPYPPASQPSFHHVEERKPVPPPPPPAPSTVAVTDIEIQAAIAAGKKIVRAMYDYQSDGGGADDLNFQKGDIMEITSEDGDWWYATNMATGQKGYIPNSYVVKEDSFSVHSWYHDEITRADSEQRLLACNSKGFFLIRVSQTTQGAYTLSLLDVDMNGTKSVKHYKIRNTDEGKCYIATKRTFSTLPDLVKHYNDNLDGLLCKLEKPCPKPKPQMFDLSRNLRDKWEVPRTEVQLGELLGKGCFGEVYKGIFRKNRPVAVKTLRPGTMTVEKFLEEAAIMKKIRHPKLVTLYAVCTVGEPIYIITELMPYGSLLECLRSQKGQQWTPVQMIDIGSQVADGMNYLEQKHHIHRDLAARNVLVGEGDSVKIGDFGLARTIENDTMYTAQEGARFPIKWTAPEACIYGKFSIKSDVWAYAILLIEVFSFGAIPYPGMNNGETIEYLQRGKRHARPEACPQELYDNILLECWKNNPSERPTFEYLYNTMADYEVSMGGTYQ